MNLYNYQLKTKEAQVLDETILFTERPAQVVFGLIEYVKKQKFENMDDGEAMSVTTYINATIVADSIEINARKQKYLERRRLLKKYTAKNIIYLLSPAIIAKLADFVVQEVEGNKYAGTEPKKKSRAKKQ